MSESLAHPAGREWLSAWRASVAPVLADFVRTFEQRFGFEPGTNELRPPASEDELAALAALGTAAARDLAALYENTGEVSLPDVGNGYFIHPPDAVMRDRTDFLRRIGPPWDVDVLLFGSDGGGALYVLPLAEAGPVYRLRDCAVVAGVADPRSAEAQIAARDLQDFLRRLREAVSEYASTGDLTSL